jgi:3',5'-cyclic AMP phosphodiesterase CpdA
LALTLAHLSDVHLGPLPKSAAWKDFALKRVIGTLSWKLNRHKLHDPAIAAAVVEDIKTMAPDHVAFTGDLLNISAHAEFQRAARWMENFGDPAWISFVPGNHDAYVPVVWKQGLAYLAPFMTGDMAAAPAQPSPVTASTFPYVRLRRNLAMIGLNSAAPQSLTRAAGSLGPAQLQALAKILRDLKAKGYYRAVMIHHPPLPGLAPPRKALSDAANLRDVLWNEGAEVVLHGHNHREMLTVLAGREGNIPVVGVPSASMNGEGRYEPAAWNLYEITRNQGKWATQVSIRGWDPESRRIVPKKQFMLPS